MQPEDSAALVQSDRIARYFAEFDKHFANVPVTLDLKLMYTIVRMLDEILDKLTRKHEFTRL